MNQFQVAITVLIIWSIIVPSIFGIAFGYFRSSFFSFGPSPTLYIIGINYPVATWPTYIWLSIFCVVQRSVTTFVGDTIFPWVSSVILNPDIPEIRISKLNALVVSNITPILFDFLALFNTGLALSQFDFWLYSFLGTTIIGLFNTAYMISKKTVEPAPLLDNGYSLVSDLEMEELSQE